MDTMTNEAAQDILLGLAIWRLEHPEQDATHRVVEVETGRELGRGTLAASERLRLGVLERRHGAGQGAFGRLPTLGGAWIWRDEVIFGGHRIQRRYSDKDVFRLLDPEDRQLVRGSFSACRVGLERCRIDLGLRPRGTHGVIILHGLFRTRRSMAPLRRAIERAGFEAIPVDYPSTRGTLEEHASQVERVLCELHGIETVSFVTHSMGGLVARCVLGRRERVRDWRCRIAVGRLLMIFPPSNGSQRAEFWRRFRWLAPITGPATDELSPARASQVPVPEVPTAIIAGGRGSRWGRSPLISGDNDGTVAVEEAWLPGVEEFRVLDVGHTLGLRDAQVIEAAVAWLRDGSMVEVLARSGE